MAYTRQQWATDFLHGLGNNNPAPQTVDWVIQWTRYETAPGQTAAYNLLNTTMSSPDAISNYNSVGVKNYSNYNAGILANDATIENGYYPSLLQALKNNDLGALGYGQGSPTAGVMANLRTWCGGCGYGNAFAQGGTLGANDTFSGTASTISSTVTPAQGATTTGTTAAALSNDCGSNLSIGTPLGNVCLPWSGQQLQTGAVRSALVIGGALIVLIALLFMFRGTIEKVASSVGG